MDRTHSEGVKKLWDMIKDVRVAMMTTVAEDGSLHSRPMATQQTDFDGDIWFFTGARSLKVFEVQRDHKVNLSYANPDDERYVSVSGSATLVRDRKKAEQLWNPLHKAWFPKGLDDPDLAMLKVTVERAEYWDAPSSTMVQIAGFVKAMLTGERYEPGEHGKVDL
jgi:general stress protein 26